VRAALLLILSLAACPSFAKEKPPKAAPAPALSRSRQVMDAPDLSREFAMEQLNPWGRANSFQTKSARSDTFYFQQKYQPKAYDARAFKAKDWWGGDFKFSTKAAGTTGKYEVPKIGTAVDTPTKAVKDAQEAGKSMSTRDLPDGSRPYLGKEAQKMQKPLDPTNLPKITNEMHELKTIEDVKELLNKNR
jgi:hypothetical protein